MSGILDLARLGIERRERADRRQQHPHRMRVVAEALHELLDVLVHERVDRDLVRPLVELLLAGQLTVDQQVGDLEVARALGQLLDRIAPVLEDAVLAVDERDRRAARRRGHVGRVVGHQAEVVLLDLDVAKLGGTDRAVLDRNLVLLAGPVVGDGQGLVRRGCAGAVVLLRLCRHGAPSRAIAGVPRAGGMAEAPPLNLVPRSRWRDARADRRVTRAGVGTVRRGDRLRPARARDYFGKALVMTAVPMASTISTPEIAITPRAPRSW